MNPCLTFKKMQCCLEKVLSPFHSAAVISSDGLPLLIKYQSLADIGTFPVAAQVSHQYMPLNDGDIVISNDPYSGGSVLSTMTLILGLSTDANKKSSGAADLLICLRVPFKPRLSLSQTVEDEGLRIPPTPLQQAGKLNLEIVEGIGQHPQSPEHFVEQIRAAIADLNLAKKKFQLISKQNGIGWSKSDVRSYVKSSNRIMKQLIGELSEGEAMAELAIDENTKLKLKMEIGNDKVIFDFSGSASSSYIYLTDAATFGACAGALVALFDKDIPLNAGVFEALEILAPSGTLVNAQYPQPVYLGMTDGTALVASLVLKTVGEIDSTRKMPISGMSQCTFDVEFSKTQHFFETLETGMAATNQRQGLDGVNMWRRTHLEPSIEEIEDRYPLTIRSYSYRPQSGGSGAYAGGDGISKTLRVKQPATLRWMITEPIQKPEGVHGGKTATGAEIIVERPDKKREVLGHRGEIQLQANDTVIVHSAGGGGYGE